MKERRACKGTPLYHIRYVTDQYYIVYDNGAAGVYGQMLPIIITSMLARKSRVKREKN